MSETVMIALITFASGLAGAGIGAFATYKVSTLGVKIMEKSLGKGIAPQCAEEFEVLVDAMREDLLSFSHEAAK